MLKERFEKAKNHVKENKVTYLVVGSGVTLAIITLVIMRDTTSRHISRGIPVAAQGGIPVLGKSVAIQNNILGKNNVLNSVSYISADRKGPPSWVVRCKETGAIFTSQKSAANNMYLPANEISRHLNGVLDNVRGYHFERICMAA